MSENKSSPVYVTPSGEVKTKRITTSVVVANVFAGLLGPLVFSPLIAIVDGSIINSVNGDKTPVLKGIISGYKSLFTQPRTFFRQEWRVCALCYMVYAGTYASTNNVRSYVEVNNYTAAETDALKFAVSLGVNLGLTQIKDGLLVKEYARRGIKKETIAIVPLKSRALFLVRDSLTMFAAFCLAERLAEFIYTRYQTGISNKSWVTLSNFIVPAALQPISTFFHLWALEHAHAVTNAQPAALGNLTQKIRSQYAISTASRVARIVPAISVGNNVNMEFRSILLSKLA